MAMLRIKEIMDESRGDERQKNQLLSSCCHTCLGIKRMEVEDGHVLASVLVKRGELIITRTIGGIDLVFHTIKFLSDHQRT